MKTESLANYLNLFEAATRFSQGFPPDASIALRVQAFPG